MLQTDLDRWLNAYNHEKDSSGQDVLRKNAHGDP